LDPDLPAASHRQEFAMNAPTMHDLRGKLTVVTGGGDGVGLQPAR
jgi:hypothetical protein